MKEQKLAELNLNQARGGDMHPGTTALLLMATTAVVACTSTATPLPPPAPAATNTQSCATTPADYPRESLRAGEEGVSRIRVSIDAEGKIASMQVARSSGYAALDEASMKKLSQCKFRPGRDKSGNPVGGTTEVEYRWSLQKN